MRRLVYSVAMSLDGYIAGPQGEYDWIVMDPEIDFGSLFAKFDTAVVGRKTFAAQAGHGGDGTVMGMKTVVISRTLTAADCPKATLLQDNLAPAITKLKAEPGKDLWLFGGGELFRGLLELNLVDGVEVAIVPVLLGGGIPFLPAPAARAKLKLASHKVYSKTGTVWLEYTVEERVT